jgi:cytochrome b
MRRILVWDWPTRLIHWLMVLLVFFSWGSAEYGQLELHRYSGYVLTGLLAFRIYWGFAGSETARFSRFLKGPKAVAAYLKSPTPTLGHNPLGALSVIVLLALLIAQVTLGMFAVDIDGIESGPLSHWVSFDTGRAAADAHDIVFDVLLWLIVLHVVAVLYYLTIRRNNLIGPMFTGKKTLDTASEPMVSAPLPRVLIGIVLAVGVVWWIIIS